MLPAKEKAKVNMINLAPYNREGQKLELIHYVTNGDGLNPQHLYFLSDDKIEEGEFGINLYSTSIFQVVEVKQDGYNVKWITGGNIGNDIQFDSLALPKKIIATTDTSLKIPGVDYDPRSKSGREWIFLPQPSQGFIKVFIEEYNKSNVITDVMVEYYFTHETDGDKPLCVKAAKDNTITIKKLKDSWNKCEHAANLIKYRQDYEQFKKDSHFGPNQREIEEWSNKWIEENL